MQLRRENKYYLRSNTFQILLAAFLQIQREEKLKEEEQKSTPFCLGSG